MNAFAGWILVAASVGMLAYVITHGPVTWLALLGVGCVFGLGVAMALRSRLVTLSRQVAYAIREVRAAVKGEPEPPPPSPDLMQTIKPGTMAAPPRPPEAP